MMKTILNSDELRATIRERLAVARHSAELQAAAAAVAELEQAEAKALAELQQPLSEEDPFRHDSARKRLATIREQLGRAKARLRSLAEAANQRAGQSLQELHQTVWESVENAVRDLIAAETLASSFRTAAGGAAAGMFFGGLDALTGIRVRLEAIERDWTEWKGGRR